MCHCVSFWFKRSRKMAKILTVSRKSYHPIETFLVHSVVMWLSNVSSALIAPHKETLKSTWVFVEHNIRHPEIDRIHYRQFHYTYIQNVMAVKMYCMHFSHASNLKQVQDNFLPGLHCRWWHVSKHVPCIHGERRFDRLHNPCKIVWNCWGQKFCIDNAMLRIDLLSMDL